MNNTVAVILAAGEGKRMNSSLPKVLHKICGKSMVEHVLDAARAVCHRQIVVVGHGADQVRQHLGDSVTFALQEEQLGTGHAVAQAEPFWPAEGRVIVLCGDTPLISPDTLIAMLDEHVRQDAAVTVLTARVPVPAGYGRVVRGENGQVRRIVEEKDASGPEKAINEINTGTYVFDVGRLRFALKKLQNNNAQGEYYLTDCLEILVKEGLKACGRLLEDYCEALGVNDRAQLAEAGRLMRERINSQLMHSGVTIVDPATTYVDAGVCVGRDTVIFPGTILEGKTSVGANCKVGPHAHVINSIIGDNAFVWHSVINESVLADGVTVGPYAHLRPQTRLCSNVKVGDFVEIKNSTVGEHSKIPHLSYVGDARVGAGVNLGAGTIIVNYDGRHKHETRIEDGAFVGCNSNLVAPVTIGQDAFVAAGSTVTRDVPPGALSIARPDQVNKANLGRRLLKREPLPKTKEKQE